MKRLLVLLAFIFVSSKGYAETLRTVYNPFSGKPDYITVLTSGTVPSSSTAYIQNTLTPTTATQKFSVQLGSATQSFTTPTVIFSNSANVLQTQGGSSLLGYQGAFNTYLGEGSVTGTGGGFNTCMGTQCMTPFNGGLFDACVGTFCMATGGGVAGQQNGCMGYACMFMMTSGSFNNCNGGSCMANVTTASNNVCNGVSCLRDTLTDNNACDGQGCLQFNSNGAKVWGLAAHAGAPFSVATATNQVNQNDMGYLGYETSPGALGLARSTVIGNFGVVSTSDTVALRASNLVLVMSTGPAVTGCGSSPSIYGNNSAFTVTVGGTTTSCTIGFSQVFANPPSCAVSERTMSIINALSYTVTAAAVTLSQTGLGGNVFDVICIGGK